MSEVYHALVERRERLRRLLLHANPNSPEWAHLVGMLADVQESLDEIRDAVSRAVRCLVPNV
jgi:hypothetical protein